MLEKIGLPAKPSMRGNNWVVDASHCQGCSSQFTFINRKHHCRRCGGIFCNSCTHQRMVLRGQGDSPVRICEPCKQLEEAARFELRYGNKTRASRGSSKMTSKNEDEILNQILGNDAISRGTSSSCASSCSTTRQVSGLDSLDDTNLVQNEIAGLSISPEELRKQAVHEKKKYKVLKEEGKSDEAMKAFKRGKELERQADALEISIRKNRRKVLTSGNVAQTQSKDGSRGSRGKSKEKDDLTAELRELGWTDTDPHDVDKRSVGMSLEGELSSLLGDTSQRGNKVVGTSGIDKTQVVAHKRKALTLKREGKLSEAKEELKKAKLLEKQLEEQELMSGVEDSDDEISALIRSMDDDKQDDLLVGYEHDHGFDFDHLIGIADNLGDDRNLEVTGEDLMDPEIAATLKSLGWTDDHDDQQNNVSQSIPIDREVLLSEIHALKTEALNQKRAGNVAEAMAQLKQAKLLERDLESLEGVNDNLKTQNTPIIRKGSISQNIPEMKNMGSKVAPKNRLMIQKELLALKKKALTLRREGRLDEAEGELKKGRVLEQQLEDMDNASKAKAAQVTFDSKDLSLVVENSHIHENVPIVEAEEDVTEEDMHDPEYISYLRNLGWKEDNEYAKGSTENGNNSVEISEPSVHTTGNISSRSSRRSKGEIQRELLALKRKALALRREGKADEADGVLSSAKTLETLMAETEASFKKEIQVDSNRSKDGDNEFEDKNNGTVRAPLKPFKEYDNHSLHITETSITILSSNNSSMTLRSKGEIQRELLGLKRKALALRREGKTDEAEEVLSSAKALETKMLEMEASKEIEVESNRANDEIPRAPLASAAVEGDADDVIEKDMYESYDPALHSMLKNLKDEEFQPVNAKGKVSKDFSASSVHSSLPSASPSSCSISAVTPSGKGEARQDDVGGEVEPLDKIGSLKNVGIKQGIDFIPPPSQSGNIMDLLTGDGKKDFQIPSSKLEDIVNSDFIVSSLPEAHVQVEALPSSGNLRSKKDRVSFGSDSSCQAQVHAHVESLTSSSENLRSMVHVTTEKREEIVAANEKPRTYETISQGLASQNNQSSTRQEVLARKRNAVALKREGKLLEAREELRQAKLLEKSLEAETTEIKPDTRNVSTSLATAPPVQQKEFGTSNLATKQLSGRDRFKLQQESLSHKRQALKLRREGRMEEAEAEFEVAKALEMQLEEMASQSSAKSSAGRAEPVDDVMVEDLLDPQLLSALRAIGIEDANVAPKGPEIPGPLKVIPGKGENFIQERIQLEEQIKAEKVKAVTLKRSGKQAEALEALRQAKLFEKKLSSLASS